MNNHLRPTRSRWRQAFHDYFNRHRKANARMALNWNNIYVLPSKAGWMLAITLLILLLASINFQLNLGYVLTFLLAGSALASVWLGHQNLRGLQLQIQALAPVFQGERATVPVQLQATDAPRQRHGLALALNRTRGALAWVHTDLAAQQTHSIALGSIPHQRGWHRVPRIVIETRYPLGVFRLWSYWQPDARILVYPTPESPMPPVVTVSQNDAGQHTALPTGADEQDGVRSYQRGDPLRSIVWKKAANAMASGAGELVARSGQTSATQSLWLEAQATGLNDPEAQIHRLTAWVLHAHQQHWQWGLKLPSGAQLPVSSGAQHLQACLTALAIDGVSPSSENTTHA